ncbi:conserved hypothetical protein [Leishmania major strain Friedlin]|uniref:Uncharacterized protein n=1 Tax=Leishmania major TaxID=5664 RepID=Q4Q572_LEIMA|nr:conserved hypothetical protein [Leishmania major strain Friedlin]CAG9580337.1 hypothetical_protein_-_conserved [Leishmania major strain Friedlin]CAJ08730.1 conserved hypothetical protein [Leishmania major strain Friedlin]|eukprot:XP_001685526.1 conserved hypothetical protein [Leishmania major strain Friedlin]
MPSPSTASPAPPAYTGAALLAGYTSRRKIVQKAAALSARMRRQVQDVVQMEEEQRLLSQAYRGRQKLLERQPQLLQQAQANPRSVAGFEGAKAAGEKMASKARVGTAGDTPATPGSPSNPASPVEAAAASPDKNNPTPFPDVDIGLALEGALDIKQHLKQQVQEKSDTLTKMRGIQQAILELSEEATADVERRLAQRSYSTSVEEADGPSKALAAADFGGLATDDNADRHPASSTEKRKVEMIQELRSTLKEMLDAHRALSVAQYSTVGRSVRRGAAATELPGSTWLEQDAAYRPPAPLQMFSTSAFAVTLEYLSNSLACIAHIADEVCVATTFRSRADPVVLLPHLESLQKWVAQAERCLDTAQRHLRHFQSGEAALLDGGAYEVNSLREQALLLRESLTAHEQKVKTVEEAKVSVLHRLREVSRRCYLWEAHLLHRRDSVYGDGASRVSCSLEGIGSGAALGCFSTPNAKVSEPMLMHAGPNVDAGGTMVPNGSLGISFPHTTAPPACVESRLIAATTEEASSLEATKAITLRPLSTLRNSHRGGKRSFRVRSDAASRPLTTSSLRTPSLSLVSISARAHQPPTPLSLRLIEQRVARSWCNPYVRKKCLCQRAEQVIMQHQPQQRQLQGRSAEQRRSFSRVGASVSEDLGSGCHNLAKEAARAPTSQPASFISFDSVHRCPSLYTITDATAAADGATGRVLLPRLGSHTDASRNSTAAESRRRASRVADSLAASVAGSTAALGESLEDLADARTVQLLQSLLRSIPSKNCASVHDHAKSTEGKRDTGGGSGDVTANPSLVQSLCIDVTQDEAKCAAMRYSIQRLSRYLATCTTRPESSRQSIFQK